MEERVWLETFLHDRLVEAEARYLGHMTAIQEQIEFERRGACESLSPERFDAAWRRACWIMPCRVQHVGGFLAAHYLGKRPAIVLLTLLMLKGRNPGTAVGCVVFSAPPREVCARYGGTTWELARLYLLDDVPKNAETWLIAQSVKYIKRSHPEVKHLVSYADPSAGHKGTIYRAGNWRSDGRTDDERKSPRCDYYDATTGKKYGRRGNVPPSAVLIRKPRVSKYRFTMCLSGPNKTLHVQPEREAGGL